MATITVQGVVTITVVAKTSAARVTDAGTMDLPATIDGYLAQSTSAARAEQLRQLLELAWYSRHSGGAYIASSDLAILDGLYEMSVEGTTDAGAFPRVRLTLRRIGGGPLGGNVIQRVRAMSSLQTNSYSITSTPRIALPVGATSLDVGAVNNRSGRDGTTSCYASGPIYALSGVDYARNECRIYDTRGDATEANWQRVWSPDHVFSDPSHLVVENGLLRITGITGGNNGCHRYWVWTGAAYTQITDATNGDFTRVGGTVVTDTYDRILIDELSPWRINVSLRGVHSAGPQFFTKTITLERGHPLARVELITASATDLLLGFLAAGRWVFTKGAPLSGGDMQRPAFDDQEETPSATLNAPEDNWVATFTAKSSATGTLAIGAWASSSYSISAFDGGGFYIQQGSATNHVVYLGGIKYDTSSAQLEAEAGTLTGGATAVSTIAGASGSGNDQVALGAPGARVEFTTNLATIGGSTILALFRIAVNSLILDGNMSLVIRNSTSGTDLTTVTRDDLEFAAANTWYWQAVVATGWNGTDTIVLRATGNNATGITYVDQVIVIAIAGSTTTMQVDDVAAEALTETKARPIAVRQVH